MSQPGSRFPTKKPRRRRWEFLLLLLAAVGVLCLAGLLWTQGIDDIPPSTLIPVSLHSNLQADYAANPGFLPMPNLRLDIIWDAILDREPNTTDLSARQAALLASLQTPVAFVSPTPCQGLHSFYSGQDTWIDSTRTSALHGDEPVLQLERGGEQATRLLLYFGLNNEIPPDAFIYNARLEMTPVTRTTSAAPAVHLFDLADPFSEARTAWANQPTPLLQYRPADAVAADVHAWDITDFVRDWLGSGRPNNGLMIELPLSANAVYAYHSKEADEPANNQTNEAVRPLGPRLTIDCGGTSSQPEIASVLTPTPVPGSSPQLTPASSPTGEATPQLLGTPTLPAPSPTLAPPTPTALLPTTTPIVLATPTPLGPTATPMTAATPTPTDASPVPAPTNAPPTNLPQPTSQPSTSTPTRTAVPTSTPVPTFTPTPTSTPTPLPNLVINDVSISEGSAGTVNAIFTVSLSTASGQTVTVNYATTNNTALAPADYTTTSGIVTFAPGVTSQTVIVAVQGDLLDEIDETFFVNLSGAVNATIGDGQGVGTIIDDDGVPTLSINDVTVTEGNVGTVNAIFTVSLSASSAQTVTVTYASADNTATALLDYLTANGTLTFAPGVTSQTISVAVVGDLLDEINETFFVNLSGAVNAIIGDGQGVGTIIDDDLTLTSCTSPNSTLTAVADTYFRSNQPTSNFGSDADLRTKPAANPRNAVIRFNLSAIPANSIVTCATLLLRQTSAADNSQNIQIHRVTANWAEGEATWNSRTLANLWATPGGDIDPAAAATFVPNLANHVVNITSLAQFWVSNAASNFGLLMEAQSAGSVGELQFSSRQGATPPQLVIQYLPALSINDVTVFEGDGGTTNASFTVSLSAASTQIVTVNYATADNTATTANNDYLPASGILTFLPGSTSQPINVTIIGDTNVEGDEAFLVNLTGPVNAAIADGQGIGIIRQDLSGFSLPTTPPGSQIIFLPIIVK